MLDVKTDEHNNVSTARLTCFLADETQGITARIKYFDRWTPAAHLFGWFPEMRIKDSYWKTTVTNTQTTCPNHITLRAGPKWARPAEVGTLAQEFEKSATKFKLKLKLLKCKRTVQIATFNVRTLNRIRRLPKMTFSAIYHNVDIISIKEHRYLHSEDMKYHDILSMPR